MRYANWRELPHRRIFVEDTEYYPGAGLDHGGREGDLPTPLCSSAIELRISRAREHLAVVTETHAAAKQSIEADEAADTARLIDDLATGSAGRVEPVAGEKRIALADAEHIVEIANRAVDRLGDELATAEARLAAAGRAVAEAVIAMLLEIAGHAAKTTLDQADELDDARANLDALGIVVTNQQRAAGATRTPWPGAIREALSPELRAAPRLQSKFSTPAGTDMVAHWAALARRLADDDPEADSTRLPQPSA